MEATSAHFFEAVIATLEPCYLESDPPSMSDYPAALGHRATGFKQLNETCDSFNLFGSSGSGLPG
ncbi:MAG: hypothetical protein DMG32_05320 [Acidobacteria bacterium]|nr:MAG: hypothetical protein DMG32_05320 [Acidobacteriota bacterium]